MSPHHPSRFWICKIVIVIMDLAIFRGAVSMGEEFCSQDDEISEFGWVVWAFFLVFCKFVYLRPVTHLHQVPRQSLERVAKSRLSLTGSGFRRWRSSPETLLNEFTPSDTLAWYQPRWPSRVILNE